MGSLTFGKEKAAKDRIKNLHEIEEKRREERKLREEKLKNLPEDEKLKLDISNLKSLLLRYEYDLNNSSLRGHLHITEKKDKTLELIRTKEEELKKLKEAKNE